MAYETLKQAATEAAKMLGAKLENWEAIATQFMQEKGWDWWENPHTPFNVGNIKVYDHNGHLVFGEFSSLDEGVRAYVHFLTNDPAGYYKHVVEQLKAGTPESVLHALSKSPYCAPPYPLPELLSVLKLVRHRLGDPTLTPSHMPQPLKRYVTVTKYPTKHSTLWGIASDVYKNGNKWHDLLKHNPGVKPQMLKVGQKIFY